MYTDLFNTLTEQSEKSVAPFVHFNQLVAKNVEELTTLQLDSIKHLTDLGVAQVKSASEVKDVQTFVEFNAKQIEAFTHLTQQLVDDGKKLANLGQKFQKELDELTNENLKKVAPAAN